MKPSEKTEDEPGRYPRSELYILVESSRKRSGKMEPIFTAISTTGQADRTFGNGMDAVGIKTIQ
jgi:hypothetical protein